MSSITIRPAAAADLDRITEIYADAVTHGTASYELEPPIRSDMGARFDGLMAGGFPYLVAEKDGAVLGYAYAGAFRPRPAYRFIVEDSVYVAPEAKGQGVGLLLMRQLIEACRAAGFRHSGRLEGSGYKHGRWLDTVFMQLSLNGGASAPPDPDSLPERKFRQKKIIT
jgi:phosphinothricin acetyltransferase